MTSQTIGRTSWRDMTATAAFAAACSVAAQRLRTMKPPF